MLKKGLLLNMKPSCPTVIIAPWGNPLGWNPADYRLAEGEVVVNNVKTSLACLIHALKPDKVILIIPETLLCPGPKIEEFERFGGKPLSEFLEEGGPEIYREALKSLTCAMENLYREWIGSPEPHIVIAPGIGGYRCGNRSFVWEIGPRKVDPISAYAAYTLANVSMAASDLIGQGTKNLVLALDTTHGINYMPLAAYRATMAAARILSSMFNVKVELRQYNSTPYPQGVQNPQLDIYLVRKESIPPTKAAQRLVFSYLVCEARKARPFHRVSGLNDQTSSLLKELEEKLSFLEDLHGKTGPLAAAVHFSMPLALLQLGLEDGEQGTEAQRTMSLIADTLNELLNHVQLHENHSDPCRIVHPALPRYDDIKSLLASISLTRYCRETLREFESEIRIADGVVEAPLKTLEDVVERRLKGPLHEVARHELSKFKLAAKGELLGRDSELENLVREAKSKEGQWISGDKQCEDQPRILVAHAGLAHRSLQIKYEGGELYMRYRKDCLERTKAGLENALKGTRELIGLV